MRLNTHRDFTSRRIERELSEHTAIERGLAWLGLAWDELFALEDANPRAAADLREKALRLGQAVP
jgi:hypothetical protein